MQEFVWVDVGEEGCGVAGTKRKRAGGDNKLFSKACAWTKGSGMKG